MRCRRGTPPRARRANVREVHQLRHVRFYIRKKRDDQKREERGGEWWARTKARRTGTGGGNDSGRGGKYALEHERNVSCVVVSFFFSVLYAWRGMAGRRRPGREARCRAPMMAGVRRATHLRHERGETLALRRHGGARCLPTTKKSLTCNKKSTRDARPPGPASTRSITPTTSTAARRQTDRAMDPHDGVAGDVAGTLERTPGRAPSSSTTDEPSTKGGSIRVGVYYTNVYVAGLPTYHTRPCPVRHENVSWIFLMSYNQPNLPRIKSYLYRSASSGASGMVRVSGVLSDSNRWTVVKCRYLSPVRYIRRGKGRCREGCLSLPPGGP